MKDYQKILFPYAYNILGSAEDAQDVIQDVLTKYYTDAREGIENEKAYLIRSVINLSINRKNRRKLAVQPEVWLPEPVATESADANVHLKDILSYSLLVLLEKLNAKERAVFILKESFDYPHDEIAGILDITEEHSRKLLSRAKTKLFKPSETPEMSIRSERTNAMLQNYIDAIRGRNMEKLEGLLAEDIAFYADSGGKINVVRKICTGFTEVAELLAYVYHTYQTANTIKITGINHQPAFLFYDGDRLASCQVFDISPETGMIMQINSIIDPEKLKRITI
ncbi:sigma-70 family RNA polymerase sigma factor [Chitinophaga barathri]|uniref:Sigma-70 family RNA polymerase sigma factor n=1 Tax=Chitinophaga barathri TaxID=1647451 RepID=A0A3N4MI24_9BACT|nr:sigma-70 family RNA polymerase sigma factor [Chitinophaga barathri]RPD41706.1 sigma-70 family RNA polymerase sigma factor [Chitinophaga barathri]